ncbi:MAG: PD-(D/E)XK nuclease family protein, partial [Prevotella melaninogenica]
MNTFLEHVAADLLKKYGNDMAHIAVVFPNKRAALFLNQALARLADGPVWSPAYITISDFFRQHSELTIADPIKSICDLYKSYVEVTGNTNETLDHFYGWGQLLLADFDDIDKNMANAEMVFSNISNLKELDDISYLTDEQKVELRRFFANFDDNPEGIRERFITLWNKLNDIYNDFKQRLRCQKLVYEGMLYRDVVENAKIEAQYEHYVFVGFNVLQKVEQLLFKRFLKEEKASFYWDFDRYYMKPTNEAGNYIRRWLDKFPNALPNDNDELYDNLGKEKEINIISAPTENLQARYITEWLRENERYKDGKQTAIVLCDEHLLQTVIHCIPDEVDTLNVTTGYPLQQTPIASMVTQLWALQTEGYSVQEQSYRLHYVNRVLRHPYGKYLTPKVAEIIERLNSERQFYVKPKEGSIFEYHPSDKQNLQALVNWLAETIRFIGVNGAADKDPLFEESVFRMYTLLTRLSDLMTNGDLDADKIIFRRLLTQLIAATSIPFHGEPVRGVQVMGVLETRNLDFDHVLVLSCNEGNMPKGIDDASFIPHLIRKAYELTTIDNKVSIYSYYFHSMIQRAKDVTFLYNNSTQGSHTGEMSRFNL